MTTVVSAEYLQVQTRDRLFHYIPRRYFQERSTLQVGSPYVIAGVGWDYLIVDVSSQDFISLLCVMTHVLQSLQIEFDILDDIPSRYDLPTMNDYLTAFRLASLWGISAIRFSATEYVCLHRKEERVCPYLLASYGTQFSSIRLFLIGCSDIAASPDPIRRDANEIIGPLLAFRLCYLKATNRWLPWMSSATLVEILTRELDEILWDIMNREPPNGVRPVMALAPRAPSYYDDDPEFLQYPMAYPVHVPSRPPSPTRSQVPDEEYGPSSPVVNGWARIPELGQQETPDPGTDADGRAIVPFIPPSPDLIPVSPELVVTEEIDLPPIRSTPSPVSENLPPIRSIAGVAEHLPETQPVDSELVEWLSNYSGSMYVTDESEDEKEDKVDNQAEDQEDGDDSQWDTESDEFSSDEEDDYVPAGRKLSISFLLNPAPGWVPPRGSVAANPAPRPVSQP